MMMWVAPPQLVAPATVSQPAAAKHTAEELLSMPFEQLEQLAPDAHPIVFFMMADRKFQAGAKDAAVRWLYVGQIRWRFYLKAHPDLPPDEDPAVLASIMETIGRPINEWAGGNVDGWIASMQAALDWDAENRNGFTSKSAFRSDYENVRSTLADFIATVREKREEIPEARKRNGLNNRPE